MSSRSVLALPLLFLFACSGSESGPSTSTSDTGTATGDTGSTGGDTAVMDSTIEPCSEDPSERPPGSQCVKTVTGKVVDPAGGTIPAGKLISVCGSICFFGETNADGTFTAKVGKYIKVSNFAASVHGRPDHASLYEKLPATMTEDIALANTMFIPAMPATGTAIPIDKDRIVQTAQVVTHGDVTLSFPAGTTVDLDLEDVELWTDKKGGEHLRAVKVAEKDYPSFVKGSTVKALYAMTPFDAKFDKKVSVTIKNTGMPDGPVEIVALGNEFLKEPFTAGVLQVVGTGTAKSGTVTTDTGVGLSYLTWLGVRPK
jgi:hypothetical protein